jgi:ParB family transcriptional regulator, chromosome partitioning protein
MRLKDLADTTSDLFNIPIERISIDPEFNVRFDSPEVREHIETIRDSIIGQGFQRNRPLTIRLSPDQTSAVVIDGHCRLAAVRMAIAAGAEIRNLPCVPEGKGVSAAERTLMLLTANNGLPLAPLEQAEAVKRLLSFGWTETDIGKKIGRTRQHVANLLELAGAPHGVKVMVVNGALSATEAVKTIRSEGAGATKLLQDAAAHAEASGKPKVTAKSIAAVKTHRDPRPAPAPAPVPATTTRVLERAKVPLQTAAQHVVEMAKGCALPADLRRAIDALHESLS